MRYNFSGSKVDTRCGLVINLHLQALNMPPEQLKQLVAARLFLKETYPNVECIALWVDRKGNTEEL